MEDKQEQTHSTVSIAEFRKDPVAVIERAFSEGSIEVVGADPRDRVRFSTQRYDLESE